MASTIDPMVVERYVPLLIKRAQRYSSPAFPFEETYAWGAVGLCKAARYYDPKRNFASLAIRAIDASITDGMRQAFGRNMSKTQNASLDAMEFWDAPSTDCTEAETILNLESEIVQRALAELPEIQQEVVRQRYWQERTFVQIAVALRISYSQVKKLHLQAIESLRMTLGALL